MRRLAALILPLLLLGACSKGEDKDKEEDRGKPAAANENKESSPAKPFHHGVVAALEKAGLEPEGFEQAAARPYEAKRCARGEVNKLDVLLCEFDDEAAARAGEKKLEAFVGGAVSGAVRRSKSRVLAVADRKKSDLKGEAINKLLKAFAKM